MNTIRDLLNKIEEASSNTVKVPAGLRGEGLGKTGNATSEDAAAFISSLDPDDTPSHDVVDPETGEVLMLAGETKRGQGKEQFKRLSYDDSRNDRMLREPMLSTQTWGDIDDQRESAMQTLDELNEHYNVVWRELESLVDDPEMMLAGDYDISQEIPVAIKRKDGAKLEQEDYDNFKEVAKAVRVLSTMQNVGLIMMGVTKGIVARFIPTFM